MVALLRPCVVVTCYNAPTMGHYPTRGNPVSMGHYSIKWCSGDNAQIMPLSIIKKKRKKKQPANYWIVKLGKSKHWIVKFHTAFSS
ncbi:hypothetical protein Hanom_Chr06g00558951 [Helianthus anomalus]